MRLNSPLATIYFAKSMPKHAVLPFLSVSEAETMSQRVWSRRKKSASKRFDTPLQPFITTSNISAAHGSAAVNNLTADICRHVACQKQSYVCNILGVSSTSQRYSLRPLGTHLLGNCRSHVGNDKTWSDTVRPDTSRAHLLRNRLCKAYKTGL